MDIITQTNISKSTYRIEDAQQALTLRKVNTPNYRYMLHRLMGIAPEEYNDMEYDLSEHSRIIDTEAFVAAAFRKKRQLILKNGFEITSESQKNLEYIKKRLEEFEFVTSQSFRDLVSEVTENMVNFNNCFILKYRKEESSSGLLRELPNGKEFKPIAGLFVLAAPTIDTATNPKTGQIIRYRHRITERFSKQFKPDDIYHIYENKRVGITIGTPPLEPVKDDIIILRSIEQDTESMIHRHANPIIQVQVGTDNSPARILGDGTSEVDLYSDIIDHMAQNGGISTPHRVNVKMLGAESQALRLETYLEYFKNRVLTGLCISEVDLGGASKGDSDIASNSLKEEVRSYQDCISNYITNYIFNELLLESPMYSSKYFIPENERVYLKFIESDLDKRIKIESHYLNLFVSGLINKEAAIKNMKFETKDLAPDVIETNSKTNSVRNTISNNIIEPKNQHNIKDSLQIKHYKPLVNYYSKSYKDFKQNLLEIYPENIINDNELIVKKIFNKLDDIFVSYGLEYVNEYVESSMFTLLGTQNN